MNWAAIFALACSVGACAQVASESVPLNASAEARCTEFGRIASDMTTTAYRRATAVEQLRALRCPGYQ
jgi:hypothetical protein